MDALDRSPPDEQDEVLAPITGFAASKLLVLSNLLRRATALRYQRMLGLSSVEFGIIAMLGRRAPITLNRLAALMGVDKAQASRAVAEVVTRGLVARQPNPRDNREVLIALTPAGLRAHDAMVEVGQERNAELVCDLSETEEGLLYSMLARLTERAYRLLDAEQRALEEKSRS